MIRRLVTVVVLLAVWVLTVRLPVLHLADLPSPVDVLTAARDALSDELLYHNTLVSAGRVLSGFALAVLAGVPIGLFLGRNRVLHRLVFPAMELLRPIPPLAWGPLSVVALPALAWSIVFVTFLGAFFPILVSTIDGAQRVDRMHLRAARCLGARRRAIFTEVVWPSTVPVIVGGAAIGIGLAWMNLIAAEMIAGGDGLGYALWDSFQKANNARVVFLMIAIGLIGWLTTAMFTRLGRHAVRWQPAGDQQEWSGT